MELCVLREIFAPHYLFFLFRTTHCVILLSIFRKNNHTGEVWPTMLHKIDEIKFDGTPLLLSWFSSYIAISDFGYKSRLFSLSEKCWIRIRIRMNFLIRIRIHKTRIPDPWIRVDPWHLLCSAPPPAFPTVPVQFQSHSDFSGTITRWVGTIRKDHTPKPFVWSSENFQIILFWAHMRTTRHLPIVANLSFSGRPFAPQEQKYLVWNSFSAKIYLYFIEFPLKTAEKHMNYGLPNFNVKIDSVNFQFLH